MRELQGPSHIMHDLFGKSTPPLRIVLLRRDRRIITAVPLANDIGASGWNRKARSHATTVPGMLPTYCNSAWIAAFDRGISCAMYLGFADVCASTKRIWWKRNHLTSSSLSSRRTTLGHGKRDPFPPSYGRKPEGPKGRGWKSPVEGPTCAFSSRSVEQDASRGEKICIGRSKVQQITLVSGKKGPSNGFDRTRHTQLALHRRKRGVSSAVPERFRGL